MATNEDLKEFIEQLLTNWDPNIDLSPDAAVQTAVIDPIVAYVGEDPLDTEIEKFLRERVAEQYSQLESEGGSPISQLIIGPARVLLGPIVRSVNLLKDRQRADLLSVHTKESLTAKLSNMFLEMGDGQYASGSVRVYYESPRFVEATTDKVFSTAAGLQFFPNGNQELPAANMLFNREGAYYYFDVQVIAQSPGSSYNVATNEIVTAQGFPGYSRVTNRFAITQGVDEETIEEFWYRASVYPTETSLNTYRGITANTRERFPGIADMALVGHGDEEMIRDILRGGGYGKPVAYSDSGTDTVALIEDGDYDLYSPIVYTDGIDFTVVVGPVGAYATPIASVDVRWDDTTGIEQFETYDIVEIIDANTVRMESEIALDSPTALYSIAVRLKTISISEIPGGFHDPDTTVPLQQPDSIHIGGATDVYLKDPDPTTDTVDMALVSDETYVAQYERAVITTSGAWVDLYDAEGETFHSSAGSDCQTLGTNWVRLNDLSHNELPLMPRLRENAVLYITAGTAAGYYRVLSISISNYFTGYVSIKLSKIDGSTLPGLSAGTSSYHLIDYTSYLEKGSVLHLTSGEPGAYRVIRYSAGGIIPYSSPVVRMHTDYVFTSTSIDNTAKLYDDVEIDLKEPKNVRIEDYDLDGVGGTKVFVSTTGNNFSSLGVTEGDVLRILSGSAEGDYTVDYLAGAGNSKIVVEESIETTVHGAHYKVFESIDGPELPVLIVNSVDVLDSGLVSTGVEIPCGDPLGFRTGEFTNFAEGAVAETTRATLGIFSTNPEATFAVDSEQLELTITYPSGVVLGGVMAFTAVSLAPPDLTLAEVVSQINTFFGDQFAVAITIGSLQYLGIRPIGDTNISVESPGGTDAAIKLGLIYEGTAAHMRTNCVCFPDPVTADISRERDFIYIKQGANAPNLVPFTTFDATSMAHYTYLDDNFWPEGFATALIGHPSLGRVRAYFKDPTYFFVNQDFRVTVEDDGVDKDYMIYPLSEARVIPGPDSTSDRPTLDEPVTDDTAFHDVDAVFWSDLIRDGLDAGYPYYTVGLATQRHTGDLLRISYRTCWFDTKLPSPLTNWAGEWMSLSVGDSQVETISFTDSMTEQDVVDTINAVFAGLASIVSDSDYWLVFNSQEKIDNVTLSSGISSWATFYPTTNDNVATNAGDYLVDRVRTQNSLGLVTGVTAKEEERAGPSDSVVPSEVQYEIFRASAYHIGPTAMEQNKEAGFYYTDFDMISFGVGNEFNVEQGLYGEPENYTCKGYRLGTDNAALSFSPTEELRLFITGTFIEQGLEARASKATVVASSNFQMNYDYSTLVQSLHDYVSADSERILVASTMAKHMLPHYVGATISYRGGPNEPDAKEFIEELIETVYSGQTLEVSDIINKLYQNGATYVNLPVELYVLYQDVNRSLWMEIVTNTDTLSRLASYFADLDRLTLSRGS